MTEAATAKAGAEARLELQGVVDETRVLSPRARADGGHFSQPPTISPHLVLRNFELSPEDSALVASSSGCTRVPIEMAEGFRARGLPVVAIISRRHSEATVSNDPRGVKLQDYADVVLDTGAPAGDAMVEVSGLPTPVAPGTTIGGCLLINAIKAEVAARLTAAGQPPTVLTASALVGSTRSTELFESAYDEHARRLARLYENVGLPSS